MDSQRLPLMEQKYMAFQNLNGLRTSFSRI
jgi:hypothetical protein